jgi:hypothetical protein
MSDHPPPGAVAIGSKLYLFKSKSNSTDCLISAHGGYYKSTNTFTVPEGVELVFYGAHGNTLGNPGIKLMDYEGVPLQVIPNEQDGSECMNYALSKFQGRHGDANKPETYAKIADRIAMIDENQSNRHAVWLKSTNPDLKQMLFEGINRQRAMNVVTIRNRWFLPSGDVYLKDVIKEVRDAFPLIKRFHCSFCRSLVGSDQAEKSVVTFA